MKQATAFKFDFLNYRSVGALRYCGGLAAWAGFNPTIRPFFSSAPLITLVFFTGALCADLTRMIASEQPIFRESTVSNTVAVWRESLSRIGLSPPPSHR